VLAFLLGLIVGLLLGPLPGMMTGLLLDPGVVSIGLEGWVKDLVSVVIGGALVSLGPLGPLGSSMDISIISSSLVSWVAVGAFVAEGVSAFEGSGIKSGTLVAFTVSVIVFVVVVVFGGSTVEFVVFVVVSSVEVVVVVVFVAELGGLKDCMLFAKL
jgi:hypothetical protein